MPTRYSSSRVDDAGGKTNQVITIQKPGRNEVTPPDSYFRRWRGNRPV